MLSNLISISVVRGVNGKPVIVVPRLTAAILASNLVRESRDNGSKEGYALWRPIFDRFPRRHTFAPYEL